MKLVRESYTSIRNRREVRCRRCHSVLKADYISNGCPMCGATPFIADRVDVVRAPREYDTFICRIVLGIVASMLPMYIPAIADLVNESAFGMNGYMYIAISAIIVGVSFLLIPAVRRIWAHDKWGWVLACAPTIAPYVLLLLVWCVVGLAIGVLYIVLYMTVLFIVYEFVTGNL